MVYLIIVLSFYFIIWFFKNDYSLATDFYIGRKGCGKTATIARFALKYSNKGFLVYTNVPYISNTYLFNPKQLDDRKPKPNSIVLLDEVSLVWSNRDFKNFRAEEFFRYCRQYKCKVIMFSQSFDVDLKIRNLCDRIFIMSRIGKIVLYRPVTKKVGVIKRADNTGDLGETYAYGSIFGWSLMYLPRYYGLFESFNPPDRSLISSVLQKCTESFKDYRTFKNWCLYCLKEMSMRCEKVLGIISAKIIPVILQSKIKNLKRPSNGRATVATISPLFFDLWLIRIFG